MDSVCNDLAHGVLARRMKGTACRWNERGFGFIKPSDGSEDLFCHFSAITDGNCLAQGAEVEYTRAYDDRKGNYRATEVTGGSREERGGGGGGYGGGYEHAFRSPHYSVMYYGSSDVSALIFHTLNCAKLQWRRWLRWWRRRWLWWWRRRWLWRRRRRWLRP